jgi:pyruvate/2-oxoglutarate dehydrogenase complex dihydrolipoamide acyltransferase (E2) component
MSRRVTVRVPIHSPHPMTVCAVLVQVGDSVRGDQPLVELDTDLAVVEIPAPVAGVVEELLAPVGKPVENGSVLLIIRTELPAEPTGAPDRGGE